MLSALSLKVHEALSTVKSATLNSKSEIQGYRIARLTVSQSEWESSKGIDIQDKSDISNLGEILNLKSRVVAHVCLSQISDLLNFTDRQDARN